MDKIDAMRVFTRVYERRSFSHAADDLHLPRSSVTDAVKQIEKGLGIRLLERTTRQVTPTVDGEVYYRRCLSLLADLDDMESLFTGSQPQGNLRVDVHGTLGRHFILPTLPDFLARYPEIQLYLSEGDRLVDMVSEGIDCVVRVGQPQVEHLIAQPLTLLEEVTVAAPSYLARYGTLTQPDELDRHDTPHRIIAFQGSHQGGALPLEFMVEQRVQHYMVPPALSVNSAETLVAAARQGLGMIQVPRYHIEADLQAGRLVPLYEAFPPPPSPVYVLYPRYRQHVSRVRVFIDWLKAVFAQEANR